MQRQLKYKIPSVWSAFGAKLKKARKAQNLTQTHVAHCLGLTQLDISDAEIGKNVVKRNATQKLSEFFNVTSPSPFATKEISANPVEEGLHGQDRVHCHNSYFTPVIDKDIPIPKTIRIPRGPDAASCRIFWPFADMQVGDSFQIPADNTPKQAWCALSKQRKTLSVLADAQFVARLHDDVMRIWRIL